MGDGDTGYGVRVMNSLGQKVTKYIQTDSQDTQQAPVSECMR